MKKRHALISATRVFSGVDGAPRIVAIVPLSPDVDSRAVSAALAGSIGENADGDPNNALWKLRCVPMLHARSTEVLTPAFTFYL